MALQAVYPAMATANVTMIRLSNGTVAKGDSRQLSEWYTLYQDRLDDEDINFELLQSVGPNPANALDVLDVQPGDADQWLLVLSDAGTSRSEPLTSAEMRTILEPRS